MAYSSHAEGFCSTKNGYYFHPEGAPDIAYGWKVTSEADEFRDAIKSLGTTVNEVAEALKSLQQCVYNQLGTASSVMTENPKQKSGLEISNRIEISDEFLNLKIDN